VQKKFETIKNAHQTELTVLERKLNTVGYTRLLLAAAVIAGVFLTVTISPWFWVMIVVCLVLFVAFTFYNYGIRKSSDYRKGIIKCCDNHLDRINGKWTAFPDIGAEFIDTEHMYSADLDIVGDKSLFQFLNTTATFHGRTAFAQDLLQMKYTKNEITARQAAISELASDPAFSCDAQHTFSKVGVDTRAPKLIAELQDTSTFINNKFFKFIVLWFPIVAILTGTALIIFGGNLGSVVAVLILAGLGAIWSLRASKAQKYLGILPELSHKLSAYNDVIKFMSEQKFKAAELVTIAENLKHATRGMHELDLVSNKINMRNSGLMYFVMNLLFWWDFRCVIHLQTWKAKYANKIEEWFTMLGKFESLLSFSHLPLVCETTCIPIIGDTPKISATELGHPLITNEKRVCNNFELSNNIVIISGSNMSGKTTFLRTIGVNLVLTRAGGFCCAKTLSTALFEAVTSMRIADNLSEGISTFYAELKRIKNILEFAKSNKNALFLIDEIFRGTNSTDRLTGAKTVIKKLESFGSIGLISTHDLELCEMTTKFPRIENYNFSEHYKDKKILFDYIIKPGKSQTTNAMHLMELVGIA
jgi:DNA mismatch repair ATPase MutS